MSLILDALRKIEQERKTRRQGSGDLRADVLSYRGCAPPPARSRLYPLVGTVALLTAAASALLLWHSSAPRPVVANMTAPAANTHQPAVQPAPSTISTPPVLPQPVPPAASPHQAATQLLPQRPAAKAAPALQPTTLRREDVAGSESQNLVVSGIAWQEERGLRRAVVNGSLVGEGAEILGTRIVEIRENRVRFSRNGKSWDIPYTGGAGRE